MKNLFTCLLASTFILLCACSKDDASELESGPSNALSIDSKIKSMEKFANILSQVVYDQKGVREFLKKESVKQFDKNYDVLYFLIKDKKIGDQSFRDIIMEYSSVEEIEEIEENVPLLNILIPEIELFNVHPESLDTEDREIPVAISKKNYTSILFNGKEELRVEKGHVPNFHLFVVNENSRVVIPSGRVKTSSCGEDKSIEFISPNYDGTNVGENSTRTKSISASYNVVGQKTIDAFKYFYADNGSINQRALQRDYVYYGITPANQKGRMNHGVSEYISYIEVNPSAYFTMWNKNDEVNEDPFIKDNACSKKKRRLTPDELVSKMWESGVYNFRFEIISSSGDKPQIVYIPVKPSDIWNFNISCRKRHKTTFRRSKYYYKIDPNKFTSKKYYLGNQVDMGKWNIANESIYRYVKIYEKDPSVEVTEVQTFDVSRAYSKNFKGGGKIGVGLKDIATIDSNWSVDVGSTTTKKETKQITTHRKQYSDHLGDVKIYFYEPLVLNINKSNKTCSMHTYNAGPICFGITVR
jgi:hypothetical protein